MPRRKHKKYSRPRKLYDKARIEEENILIKKYGLKSKREIWKADAYVERIRNLAKSLITKEEKQNEFLKKLRKIGLKVNNMEDILALNKEDILKRRLQTIVFNKKLARTAKQARQLIVHKHVKVTGRKINSPSYIIKSDEEDKVEVT